MSNSSSQRRRTTIFRAFLALLLVAAAVSVTPASAGAQDDAPAGDDPAPGSFRIVDGEFNRYLEASFGNASTTNVAHTTTAWDVIPTGDGTFYIQNSYTRRFLDADASNVGLADSSEQGILWTLVDAGDDSYYIVNVAFGTLLNADRPGFNVNTSTDPAPSTSWTLVPTESGLFPSSIALADQFRGSFQTHSPNLIRVPIADDGTIGEVELVAIGGEWVQPEGFGANGIIATQDESHLIVAQATGPENDGSSALFVLPIDRVASSLDATRIQLDEPLLSGDGLVLDDRTLYVVGGPGVTEIELSDDLTSGDVQGVLTVPGAVTPTTAAAFSSQLYVVDANFPVFGTPDTPFQVTAIAR